MTCAHWSNPARLKLLRQSITFVFRVQREFGAMAAALGGVDAIVFCGGIGENSRLVRSRVCERLAWIGVELDHTRNNQNASVISSEMSRVQIMVLKTNEELVIARAIRVVTASGKAT